MDGKTIISYSLGGRKDALEITRKIYGFKDASNRGQYIYERKGILTDIQHEKLGKGVFMISTKDADKIIKQLVSLKIKRIKVMDVVIKKKSLRNYATQQEKDQ
ncbi:MAG TPA: hypothetical protein VJC21_05160 [Candidatus Nanoarchaeia archaeon]|nr:hypothetical protein [Candidatus Nanoarchaeia archaeon]